MTCKGKDKLLKKKSATTTKVQTVGTKKRKERD
jgi:hypothetical protein